MPSNQTTDNLGVFPRPELPAPPAATSPELIRLQAEITRLGQVIARLTEERDSYRRAAQAWAMAEITDADIERYGTEEPGLPLEAFVAELELSAQDPKHA